MAKARTRTEVVKPREAAPRRTPAWVWGLLCVLLVAAVSRFALLDVKSLWWDEFISLGQSTGNYRGSESLQALWTDDQFISLPLPRVTDPDAASGWAKTWQRWRLEVHPPLYYVVLRIWRQVFGPSDFAARGLSALASVAAVGLIFYLGRLLFDPATALWAAALMAVSGVQVLYAMEVRSYALLVFVGVGAAILLVRLERRPNWGNAIGLALCVAALALTHYLSFGAIVAMVVYAAMRLRSVALGRAAAAFFAAALIFLVIWGPGMWSQRQVTDLGDFVRTDEADHVLLTLYRVCVVPVRIFLLTEGRPPPATVLFGAVYLVPALMLRTRPQLLLPWLWLVGTVGFVAALDMVRSSRQLDWPRYTLLAGIGLYLVVPAMAQAHRLLRHLVPAGLALIAIVNLPTVLVSAEPDWRSLGEHVGAQVPPDAVLVFDASTDPRDARQRYVAIEHYGYAPDRAVVFLTGPPSEELWRRLQKSSSVWVVLPPNEDTQRVLPGAIVTSGMTAVGAGSVVEVELPAVR